MKNLKAIIFDFGGVLLDLDISKTKAAMGKLLNTEMVAPYKNKYREITLALEKGEMLPEAFIFAIQSMCEPVPQGREVVDAWNAMLCGWQQDRFTLLDELKKDYNIYLLSNTNQIHLDYVMRELKEVYQIDNFEDRFFDQCFYSHKMNAWKPEKEIYKQVEAIIGLERSEFIFIDDNSNNVIGAKELGWQAYLHPTNTDLRLTLNNAGIGI
ncbi:MAG: HAD-IA family hydrolase [Saprospiraceae bacterium]|nr:HAD-IA family hydrolase [Saprospiraceae bacterium]